MGAGFANGHGSKGELMARVVVCDVNGTLLDLAALDPVFGRLFGRAGARREWFEQVLQTALVATVTGVYADFGAVGMAALEMVSARQGVPISDDARDAVREGMRRLPAHADTHPALERLRDAGFRLAALTNNPLDVVEAQLENAGLSDLFEQVLSADMVKRLKPAAEPYRMAAERLRVPVEQLRLVAAHSWDVAGAMRGRVRRGVRRASGSGARSTNADGPTSLATTCGRWQSESLRSRAGR